MSRARSPRPGRARGRAAAGGDDPSRNGRGPGWPAGVTRVGPEALRWRMDPRELREVLREDEARARAEDEALVAAEPDPRARRRIRTRLRLEGRPPIALEEVVGQERALAAIAAGLGSEAPGFHLFVCGPPGSGREALVRAALARMMPPFPRPRDLLYVANFGRPDHPQLITLPRGKGRRFRRDLDEMLAILRRAVPAALNHEGHLARCDRIRRRYEGMALRLLEELAADLRARGLVMGPVSEGFGTPELRVDTGRGDPVPVPLLRRRLERRELRATRAIRAALDRHPAAQERLQEVAGAARALARRGTLRVRRLEAAVVRGIARGFAGDLARTYPTAAVRRWLDALLDELGEKVDLFLEPPGPRDDDRDGKGGGDDEPRPEQDLLALFRANLFLSARDRPAPPVVFEPNPTYPNLFGSVESPESRDPEHLRLRAGSLVQALGGVIVVDGNELFQDPVAWRALKRTVRSGWLEVQGSGSAVRPEPIRTAFRLVAIGDEELWNHLWDADPEFAEVFKVKVQVEDTVLRTPERCRALAGAVLRTARRSGLRPPDARALARLLEHSTRLVGRNDRLAAWFSELLDVLREADRIAAERPGRRRRAIALADVDEALRRRARRHDLVERRVQEQFDDGVVLLETEGRRVGVVNALVVHDAGDHVFARPTRVSAAVGLGARGVLDIEREANFSGDVHHKGVQIVSGLLRERYAQERPLCLTASLCFEQSYALIDGDSASLAEVVALLSALADAPVEQRWAITGSLNQKGEVQAIGDVSEKIEGYYATCFARGLTGAQGVIIPESNLCDLVVRDEVVDAVARGEFSVVAVRHLDQALELLTGLPAGGRPAPTAPYPPGSIDARVEARLEAYARAAARWSPVQVAPSPRGEGVEIPRPARRRESPPSHPAAPAPPAGASHRPNGTRPGSVTGRRHRPGPRV